MQLPPKLFCLGAVLIGLAASCLPAQERDTAAAQAEDWPETPKQRAAWIPPKTSLSHDLVTATDTLFRQGLADPRGCEYRSVELIAGSSTWGFAGERIRCRAWVLPASSPDKPRFAVCWNGLVTPLVSVGAPVDLRSDVLAALKSIRQPGRRDQDFGFFRIPGAAGTEAEWVTLRQVNRLQSCLLLRLGEAELAHRMWKACEALPQVQHAGPPYLDLASEWLWLLFDRSLGAHGRGHDPVALAGTRLYVRAHKTVEAEAARLGYEVPAAREGETPHYVDFGTDMTDLLADQERRSVERHQPAERKNDQGARIQRLIRDLDQITESQHSQPGGVDFTQSPVVKSLLREGDAAVPALIECLESDKRLTRSIAFGRDFGRNRRVLHVRSAASAALVELLRTTRGELNTYEPDDKHASAIAARVREYWSRYGRLSLIERWYQTLLDDTAGVDAWLEAASNLVLPASLKGQVGVIGPLSRAFGSSEGPPKPGEKVHGDPLREGRQPSVTDLLRRRSKGIAEAIKPEERGSSGNSVDFALCFSYWDPKAALPCLQREFRRCAVTGDLGPKQVNPSGDADYDDWLVSQIILARKRGGDPDALGDYCRWLKLTDPVIASFVSQNVLEPLWRYPEDHFVKATAATLFGRPETKWGRAVVNAAESNTGFTNILTTPLIGLPAVQQIAFRMLRDRNPVGKALWSGDTLIVRTKHGESSLGGTSIGAPLGKKVAAVSIRRCDLTAWAISGISGAPRVELVSPTERRDADATRTVAFLKRFGSNLRYSELQASTKEPMSDAVHLSFPTRNRPATALEVRQGNAVFSLAEKGSTRVVNLPRFPLEARWTTLRKYPYRSETWDIATGKARPVIDYLQDGRVWQAEEVYDGTQWVRYYGFVGQHEVARVPASQIEFTPSAGYGESWRRLNDSLDYRLAYDGLEKGEGFLPAEPLRVPRTPVLDLILFNRKGYPSTAAWFPGTGTEGIVSLPKGLAVTLHRLDRAPVASSFSGSEKWEPVPFAGRTIDSEPKKERTLEAGETFHACSLDLSAWFGALRPGFYRLEVGPEGVVGNVYEGMVPQCFFLLEADPES